MIAVNPQYITDDTGKKLSVILPIEEFKHLMEDLEELDDIRLYDEAKANDTEPAIPMEDAFQMIEATRKLKN